MIKCINANSTLYTILTKDREYTPDEIADITFKIFSLEFDRWYGKGARDSYGQPELVEKLYFINDRGQKFNINDIKNTKDWNDLQKNFSEQDELSKLEETLETLKIGLIKRLSKYKHISNDSPYKKALSEALDEIEKYEKTDIAQALTTYTKYISQVFDNFKMGMLKLEGVDTSKLEEDKSKRHEDNIISFLLQANVFLKGFEPIEKLDKFNNLAPGIGTTLSILKNLQTEIKYQEHEVERKIKKEIVKHFKGLSTNPEIVEGVIDFMASTEDANLKQAWINSLGDTHNPILAAVDKLYKRTLDAAHQEMKSKTKKWKSILNKYNINSEKDFDKFLDKERGKFIEEINKDSFYEQYQAFNRKRAYIMNSEKAYYNSIDEYGNEVEYKTKEFSKLEGERRKFLNENAVLINSINSAGEKVKKYIPNEKYKNAKYELLTNEDKKVLREIKSFLEDLTRHVDIDYFEKGYVPAFNKNPVNRGSNQISDEAIISEEGNIIKFLSLGYVNKLNQKEIPNLGKEYDDTLFNEREKIIIENIKAHGSSINYNLGKSIELFLQHAITHKHKKGIENKIKLVNENLKFLKVIETSGKGNAIIDKIASIGRNKSVQYEKDFKESRLYTQWKNWVEGVFYEEFVIDEGKLTEIANFLNNTTSFMGIGFNVLSAINNKITGNIQLKIEATGKQYFNPKEYANARWMYFKNLTNFISNINKEESSNIVEGFIKEFEIYQDKSELIQNPEGFLDSLKAKARMIRDKGYFMQQIGEHQIQNTALLAMIQSHRIINGKIISFFDFINKSSVAAEVKKMQEDGVSSDKIKKYISENKFDKNKLKEDFEKHISLLDAYELENGILKLKDSIKVDKEEISDFKEKVKAINQKLHGAYNNEDAALIQRHALGRLAMQFRKWMPNAWDRRFGAKFGKTFYNERRREYNTGMYISFGKFIISPFAKSFKDYKKEQEKSAKAAFKAILNGFREAILNAKIHWHSLSEQDKANVRRSALEFSLLLTAYISALLLKGAGDDDEDNLFLAFALQQANRSYNELSSFNFGILQEGSRITKNPFAVFRTANNLVKLSQDIILYPFKDNEENTYQSGVYSGYSRIGIDFGRVFFPPIVQFGFLTEQNDKYGLRW